MHVVHAGNAGYLRGFAWTSAQSCVATHVVTALERANRRLAMAMTRLLGPPLSASGARAPSRVLRRALAL
eukprot:6211959-Pleurochrysis_carterae.AAC.2